MKLTLFSFFALMWALSTLSAHAGITQLPQTGQTTCWGTDSTIINCAGTGQDGDKRIGATLPTSRFVDNGNGTITDTLNELVWLKNGNCFGMMTWADALTASNALAAGSCGLTDSSAPGQWRLPNVKELQSLINRQEINNATWLNSQGFTNVEAKNYWSSTTYARSPGYAWEVYIYDGYLYSSYKASTYYVWPVRAGQ